MNCTKELLGSISFGDMIPKASIILGLFNEYDYDNSDNTRSPSSLLNDNDDDTPSLSKMFTRWPEKTNSSTYTTWRTINYLVSLPAIVLYPGIWLFYKLMNLYPNEISSLASTKQLGLIFLLAPVICYAYLGQFAYTCFVQFPVGLATAAILLAVTAAIDLCKMFETSSTNMKSL